MKIPMWNADMTCQQHTPRMLIKRLFNVCKHITAKPENTQQEDCTHAGIQQMDKFEMYHISI